MLSPPWYSCILYVWRRRTRNTGRLANAVVPILVDNYIFSAFGSIIDSILLPMVSPTARGKFHVSPPTPGVATPAFTVAMDTIFDIYFCFVHIIVRSSPMDLESSMHLMQCWIEDWR